MPGYGSHLAFCLLCFLIIVAINIFPISITIAISRGSFRQVVKHYTFQINTRLRQTLGALLQFAHGMLAGFNHHECRTRHAADDTGVGNCQYRRRIDDDMVVLFTERSQ